MVRRQGQRPEHTAGEAKRRRAGRLNFAPRGMPMGQGTILATALCIQDGPCDQHVMQHHAKENIEHHDKSEPAFANRKK